MTALAGAGSRLDPRGARSRRQGSAVMERLLAPEECAALAALYPEDGLFRSRIVMGRHGFGRGEYKYFSYPLPEIIAGCGRRCIPSWRP